jgi:hypothetical protein
MTLCLTSCGKMNTTLCANILSWAHIQYILVHVIVAPVLSDRYSISMHSVPLYLCFSLFLGTNAVLFTILLQAAEEMERQYAEQRAAQSNPFYNVFSRAQQQQQRQQSRGARAGSNFGRSGPRTEGGPIIDVEYSTVDDE